MKLEQIAEILGSPLRGPGAQTEISHLSYDSRECRPGDLFFAVRGAHEDGHKFAADAVAAGACGLVVEKDLGLGAPQIIVDNAFAAMNSLAAPFNGNPSRQMDVVGITGTNGKTTVAFMLESIFSQTGEKAGLMGTIQTRFAGRILPGIRTTPESVDLQSMLKAMLEAGVTRCALEVTSIGLDRHRVQGTNFKVAVFTNLTVDHLDYHQTMERYYEAKKALFGSRYSEGAVINADDPYGARLIAETSLPTTSFGIDSPAELVAREIEYGPSGSCFKLFGSAMEGGIPVKLSTPGAFSISNALAAAGAATRLGIDPQAISEGLSRMQGVPGRFERVDEGQDFVVVVDYAHTPDSLHRVLGAAREVANGHDVAVVFGCGGDRDRGKRPLMGRVACEDADLVVATSDNPRSEDPGKILSDVRVGMEGTTPKLGFSVVVDRTDAIRTALSKAAPGDVVVIAGKGHEVGQEIAGKTIPFDDREVAASALRSLV